MTEKLSDKVYLEELKLFTSAMFELDKRIIQVFGFTMTLSVTLLTWIGKILFEHTEESSLILLYATLTPNLFILPSFYYLIKVRFDIVTFASYVHLLEKRLFAFGFQSGLNPKNGIRSNKNRGGGESSDPIPFSFWAIFLCTSLTFSYELMNNNHNYLNFLAPACLGATLAWAHINWLKVYSRSLSPMFNAWEEWDEKNSNEQG
ncbi:MAG: hypothetical protein JRG74_12150 [Deltaproteobacteria bacterium]|nr:hypothetical protein [Deltaproteobacteria bacterium]MBW2166806.1 hypothetical protein [Deltaproteobacteria bacterium]